MYPSDNKIHPLNIRAINQCLKGERLVLPIQEDDGILWHLVTVPLYIEEKGLYKGRFIILHSGFATYIEAHSYMLSLGLLDREASHRYSGIRLG